MKTILASLAAAALLLAVPATSQAATFQGTSSNGTSVKLKTNAKGKPTKVKFGNYNANCDSGYTRFRNPITGFIPPFTEVSRNHILDKGRDEGMVELDGVQGQAHVVGTWRFEARLRGGTWSGSFRTRANYEQNSERITRCAARFNFELSAR